VRARAGRARRRARPGPEPRDAAAERLRTAGQRRHPRCGGFGRRRPGPGPAGGARAAGAHRLGAPARAPA